MQQDFRQGLVAEIAAPACEPVAYLPLSSVARWYPYVHLACKLCTRAGDLRLVSPVDGRMQDLLPPVLGVVGELFEWYPDQPPFGFDPSDFVEYAAAEFARRVETVERPLY